MLTLFTPILPEVGQSARHEATTYDELCRARVSSDGQNRDTSRDETVSSGGPRSRQIEGNDRVRSEAETVTGRGPILDKSEAEPCHDEG